MPRRTAGNDVTQGMAKHTSNGTPTRVLATNIQMKARFQMRIHMGVRLMGTKRITFTTWKAMMMPPRMLSSLRMESRRFVSFQGRGRAPANMTTR